MAKARQAALVSVALALAAGGAARMHLSGVAASSPLSATRVAKLSARMTRLQFRLQLAEVAAAAHGARAATSNAPSATAAPVQHRLDESVAAVLEAREQRLTSEAHRASLSLVIDLWQVTAPQAESMLAACAARQLHYPQPGTATSSKNALRSMKAMEAFVTKLDEVDRVTETEVRPVLRDRAARFVATCDELQSRPEESAWGN